MMNFRIMQAKDIPAGLALCRAAGWNQVSRDWEFFLQMNPEGCFVAEQEKVVGTVTTLRYQKCFSWIGMVLVDPEQRRQGIGMKLLYKALEVLIKESTVKLDATPAGREIYLKLDFKVEYSLSRMIRSPAIISRTPGLVRPVHPDDLRKLAIFDGEIFGADRYRMLDWLIRGASEYALIVEDKNHILGYCMGRPGNHFTQIGPLAAESADIAKELVSGILNQAGNRPLVMDIPCLDPGWKEWLLTVGFSEQRPYTRMYLGKNNFPGIPVKQYAISGPEFG